MAEYGGDALPHYHHLWDSGDPHGPESRGTNPTSHQLGKVGTIPQLGITGELALLV